jgi:hypothetical protein
VWKLKAKTTLRDALHKTLAYKLSQGARGSALVSAHAIGEHLSAEQDAPVVFAFEAIADLKVCRAAIR